ncbi:beta-hexosaminidase subunit beta [Octopus vulgaris]|nr:beta-hexosaminidase subunit beta [Octopus vulgaris]
MELFKLFLFAVLSTFSEAFQKPPTVLIHKANNLENSWKNSQVNLSQNHWAPNIRYHARLGDQANGAAAANQAAEVSLDVLKDTLKSSHRVANADENVKNNGINHKAFNNKIPSLEINIPVNREQQPSHNDFADKEHLNQEESHGKSRIVWDWHDFSINMEDYVVPEQKVRRSPISTSGEPWPLPQYYIKKPKVLQFSPNFKFVYLKHSCDIIDHAITRYRKYILQDSLPDLFYNNLKNAHGFHFEESINKYESKIYKNAPVITTFQIDIHTPCEGLYPSDKTEESYDLVIKESGCYLSAKQVWGALRGLETLSQLIVKSPDGDLYIKDVVIGDYPRFTHRGVMIDTSRHYLYKDIIFDVLEGMAQNKMNVLHWHMVDDQSFPYESKVFPELSEKGAYHPSMVYNHKVISEIIQFARLRGIRIVPEFDNPGHTYSWGLGRPDLLTQCYERSRPVNGYLGPINPTKNMSYTFLKKLLNEVLHVFKDKYIHLGGDEVPLTCWQSNPEVVRFAAHLTGSNIAEDTDVHKVLEYYERRVINDLAKIGKRRPEGVRVVLWQEVLNNNFQLPNDTIIQIWQGDMFDVERAAKRGHQIVYSTCWYLDLIEYGIKWPKYYTCDPADTSGGYDFEESDVLGGEACLWSEYIDNEEIMTRLW